MTLAKKMNSIQIQKLIDNEQFIDLFDDTAEESFYGYLTQQSEDLVQVESYDSEGRFDGIMIIDKEDISRIRWSNKEAQLTADLITKRNLISAIDLQSIPHAARTLSEHYGYTCFTLGSYGTDKMFIGEITEDFDDCLTLHEYGTRARHERSFSLLRWDDVTRVQSGGVYEHNLYNLYKNLS